MGKVLDFLTRKYIESQLRKNIIDTTGIDLKETRTLKEPEVKEDDGAFKRMVLFNILILLGLIILILTRGGKKHIYINHSNNQTNQAILF